MAVDAREPGEVVAFTCPECERESRVPAGLAGRWGLCPGCRREVRVPGARDGEDEVAAADAGWFDLACPHCERVNLVPAYLLGGRGRCPGCGRRFRVPDRLGDDPFATCALRDLRRRAYRYLAAGGLALGLGVAAGALAVAGGASLVATGLAAAGPLLVGGLLVARGCVTLDCAG